MFGVKYSIANEIITSKFCGFKKEGSKSSLKRLHASEFESQREQLGAMRTARRLEMKIMKPV